MIDFTGSYTDQYQLTMAQIYFLNGYSEEKAVFDYFFRKPPFKGGYAIFAGLEDLLARIQTFRFTMDELAFLAAQGMHPKFIEYLRDFQFKGDIYAMPEGEVVFSNTPILIVEGRLIEAQLIETLLLNLINFQTLVATKAARIRQVAPSSRLVEFGLRRAQGPGGYFATRAAIVGGFDGTSNMLAAKDFSIPSAGTMGHAFIQRYDDELSAFRAFTTIYPEQAVLLVDTYNTLESGLPNAIIVAQEMAAKGQRLKGIRLDSGDFAYLSKQARKKLDAAGLSDVTITVSNQLDEHVIKSLLEQKAPIDVFGVGTNLVVGREDAALDGVYKLSFSGGRSRMKLSETIQKTTLPGKKTVYRAVDNEGRFMGADVIALADEVSIDHMFHPYEPYKSYSLKQSIQQPLLKQVMNKGTLVFPQKSLKEIASYAQTRLSLLPEEYKRFDNPHLYKVGLSQALKYQRDDLLKQYK